MTARPGDCFSVVRSISRGTVTVLVFALLAVEARASVPGGGGYADLNALFTEFSVWRDAASAPGVIDYSPAAIARRKDQLASFQSRFKQIGADGWKPHEKVDYLLVRAHLDEQDFILNVTKPWARDPVFYTEKILRPAFAELPLRGSELTALRKQLRAVPLLLEEAKKNLDGVAGDYADLAIFWLANSDGVNGGHPYREQPPAGVIGWYEDLLQRASRQQKAIRPEIIAARNAVQDFRSWLVTNRSRMNAQNGVGKPALNWFLKHVKMLPYTADEIVVLAERELERTSAFYALERHRNRHLPEIKIATSKADYESRLAETDARVRRFLVEQEFITIPDHIPSDWREMGFNVPWIKRESAPNFWEQVQFRDPTPDHLHAVIPGHRFDTRIEQKLNHPIRKVSFGDRREGWALYLEEAALQLGLLDELPRTRELIYLFGIWRAARSIGDVKNQTNEWDVQATHAFWKDVTPWLDDFVARRYSYLRPSPAHTLHYTIGSFQMYKLLGDRKRQLGEKFVLKDFHDDFMTRGRIPIALIRYEMTGKDDDLKELWTHTPLSQMKAEEITAHVGKAGSGVPGSAVRQEPASSRPAAWDPN